MWEMSYESENVMIQTRTVALCVRAQVLTARPRL